MKKNEKLGNLLELFLKSKKSCTGTEKMCLDSPSPVKFQNEDKLEEVKRNSRNFLFEKSKNTCLDTCKICKLESFLSPSWHLLLEEEFRKNYFSSILKVLHDKPFYPPVENVFMFSKFFDINETKVVIIGQNPYHNRNQAMGLSFSVPEEVRVPPSLKNIFKELENNIPGFSSPSHGSLITWAKQGVLLLNDALTVECNKPSSHLKLGWNIFTEKIIKIIDQMCSNVVFMLWGSFARSKSALVNRKKHLVLEAAHPSPYSAANFFGCKHFSKANEYLKKNGKQPIKW